MKSKIIAVTKKQGNKDTDQVVKERKKQQANKARHKYPKKQTYKYRKYTTKKMNERKKETKTKK